MGGRASRRSGSKTPSPSRGRRVLRGLLKGVLLLAAVTLLLAGLAAISLSLPAGQQALLRFVSSQLERTIGMRLEADSLRLRLLGGRVETKGLRLMAARPDTEPFLEISDLDATFTWGSLFRPRPLLPDLSIRGVIFDLGPPMLVDTGTPSWYEKGTGMAVEIPRLEIHDIQVVGPIPGDGETWLKDWRVSDGSVRGALRDGGMVAELEGRVEIRAVLPEEEKETHWTGDLRTSAEVGSLGEVEISSLELSGPGARLSGSGAARLGNLPDLTAEAVVRVEPGHWWRRVGSVEGLEAETSVSVEGGGLRGEVRAKVDALPGEVLDPLLKELGAGALVTTGRLLELDADVGLDLNLTDEASGEERFLGEAVATWRHDDEILVAAEVRTDEAAPLDEAAPRRIEARARIGRTPGNRIDAEAEAILPSWERFDEAALERLEAEVGLADVRKFLGDFWEPGDESMDWLPDGSLHATASAAGPVRSPEGEAELEWAVGETRVAQLAVRLPSPGDEAGVAVRARLLPESPGRREVEGTVGIHEPTLPLDLETRVSIPDLEHALGELEEVGSRLFPSDPEVVQRLAEARRTGWLRGRIETDLRIGGDRQQPLFELAMEWRPQEGQRVVAGGEGGVSWKEPFVTRGTEGEISLTGFELGDWLPAAGPEEALRTTGKLNASAAARLHESGDIQARASVDLQDLVLEGRPWLREARLAARLEESRVSFDELSGTLSCPEVACREASFAGSGAFQIEPELEGALDLRLDAPHAPIAGIVAELSAAEGAASLRSRAVDLPGGLRVTVPLGAAAPWLPESVESYLASFPNGPTTIDIQVPAIEDWAAVLLPPDESSLVSGAISGSAEVDPSNPLSAAGEVTLEDLRLVSRDGAVVEADGPLRLVFGQQRVEVPEFILSEPESGSTMVTSAQVDLAEDWVPGEPAQALVADLRFQVQGSVQSELVNPYLPAVVSGEFSVDLEGSWEDGELVADLLAESPQGSVLVPAPYLTRVERPRFLLKVRGNQILVEDSTVVLNRGQVRLSGRATPEGRGSLTAAFEDVRYRVDYGMNLLAGGTVTVSRQPGEPLAISGDVNLARGLMRRDIYLDLELLRTFSLGDAALGEKSDLDSTTLDIRISTVQGVKIDNNLADLQLTWPEIRVGGTLGEPTLAGRVDAAAGGWIEAMGVLLRVDELSVEVFDDPAVRPEIDLAFTSIIDDPTLYDQRRKGLWYNAINADTSQSDLFYRERVNRGSQVAMTQLSASLADYFGDTLARFLGTQDTLSFSVEPFPLYGSTSSDGRFTIGQSFGRYARLIASSDPRQPEDEAFILELTDLLPRTTFQLFNNSADAEGATVQVVKPLDWRASIYPRLEKIEWRFPRTILKGLLAREVSLRRGDPVPPDAEFDVEVEVVETLHSLGYPGSRASVSRLPGKRGRVVLRVEVTPGPRVVEEFEGIRLPLGYRKLITAGYLPSELDLGASLLEVREEAERSLRRLGYFRPQVTVEEAEVSGVPPDQERILRVVTEAESKVQIDAVSFPGLPEEDQLLLAAEVESTLARVELAEGLPGAERRLRRIARTLGFPELTIESRRIVENELAVDVDPGPRQVVASGELRGLSGELRSLGDSISLPVGSPLRREELADQGRALIQELRKLGYAEARVELRIEPRPETPEQVDVTYVFAPGPRLFNDRVQVRGQQHTREDLLEEMITLEPGEPYRERDVAESERNLFRTTLFESVRADLRQRSPDGAEPPESEGDVTTTFQLEEGPRFLMSYGGRWETSEGASAILDLIDRNAFGRGQTVGARFVVGERRDAFRAFYGLPRTPTPNSSVEFFAEWVDQRQSFSCQAIEDAGFFLPLCADPGEVPLPEGFRPDVELDTEKLKFRGQITLALSPTTRIRPFVSITRQSGSVVTDRPLPTTLEGTVPGLDPTAVISPVLGLQLSHDTRTSSLFGGIGKGFFLGAQLRASHRSWGSDVTVLDSVIEGRSFLKLAGSDDRPVMWAQRVRAGSQFTRDGQRVPIPDQYLSGGAFSIRGYPTESFGPGQVQLLINEELHFPIWSALTGLVFFDTGNVWPTWESVLEDDSSCGRPCTTSLFSALGLGFRISAFRLDYAVPLDRRPGDPGHQIFFGFGNAF